MNWEKHEVLSMRIWHFIAVYDRKGFAAGGNHSGSDGTKREQTVDVEGNIQEGSETPRRRPKQGCHEILSPLAASNDDRKSPSGHDIEVINEHHHDEDEQRDYQSVFQYFDCHYHLSRYLPFNCSYLTGQYLSTVSCMRIPTNI